MISYELHFTPELFSHLVRVVFGSVDARRADMEQHAALEQLLLAELMQDEHMRKRKVEREKGDSA